MTSRCNDDLDLDDGPFICQLDGHDDDILDDISDNESEKDEENKSMNKQVTIINANARSLCPKIDSLVDCFEELDGTIGIVTETWLADGDSLDRDVRDLASGAGLGMVCLNRKPNDRGVAHGGVAVVHNRSVCSLTKLDLPNPEGFEVLVTMSNLAGYSRKLVTIACYLPPNYCVQRGRAALNHIEDVLMEVKRKYKDPFILVGGDFNQWPVEEALQDYPDLKEADVGPTRKDRCIDRMFTNFTRSISESGTVPPLEPEPGAQGCRSDHRIAYLSANLPRCKTFEWITYQYRYYGDESVDQFGAWLASKDWTDVFEAQSSNDKACLYQDAVTNAMEAIFPLITVRKKSTDCPWINNRIRRLIASRKGIYRREGRSKKWRRLKKVIDDLIKKRRDKYLDSQRNCLLVEDARRNFFRNVKSFQAKERPKDFDPLELFPGKSPKEAAEALAAYFNRISAEFQPLEPADIPRTHHRTLPVLEPYQVEGRIHAFKKPKSMVRGDIFPALMDKYATLLAIPLTNIYNQITRSHVWPEVWKQEFVTVIPKCRNPVGLGDLRNISCTMLPSKIYESFVLNWLSTEVSCKKNQYGGVKGCGVSHLLADMWDNILSALEDARLAIMVTAIDYAKAFNRLSFQHCLEAFARKGASTETIAILATFLSNRTMSVRVGNTWSAPLPVYGGVPQGSILGVLLFNISTDDLEDNDDDERVLAHSDSRSTSSSGGSSKSTPNPSDWNNTEGPRSPACSAHLESLSGSFGTGCGADSPASKILLDLGGPDDHDGYGSGMAFGGDRGVGDEHDDELYGALEESGQWRDVELLGESSTTESVTSSDHDRGASVLGITNELLQHLNRPLNPQAEMFVPTNRRPRTDGGVLSITDELLHHLDRPLNPELQIFRPDPRLDPAAPVFSPIDRHGLRYTDPQSTVQLDPEAPAFVPRGSRLDPNADPFTPMDHSAALTSTPKLRPRGRPRVRESPVRRRGPRLTVRDWSLMPGRRNRRRRRNLMRRISYSDEGEVSIEPEKNKKKTGLRWKALKPTKLKFVDDGMILSKINMDSAAVGTAASGRQTKTKHDLQSQNLFRKIVSKAESRGMVVNKGKTKILCISDAQTYKAQSYLLDADGRKLESGASMKVLGFHMDSRPSVHAHVEALKRRMRDTTWVLRHLKLAGFNQVELATVYRTIIRPVLDYCAVIYHPMLTDEQDQMVERLQAQALKNIYGYKDSYAVMREKAGVTTHRARRIALCDSFASKAATNGRFSSWFPTRGGRVGRNGDIYVEKNARTDRLYNSPLFYYRRRLNGKPGKTFGTRNREYRE